MINYWFCGGRLDGILWTSFHEEVEMCLFRDA